LILLANYKLIVEGGKALQGSILSLSVEQHSRHPEVPGSELRCDLERVYRVHATHKQFSPRIFWSDEVFGPRGSLEPLKRPVHHSALDIGLIQVHHDEYWVIRSEPTWDDRYGIGVYNEAGRVLFVGVGQLAPVDYRPLLAGLAPKNGHALTIHFNNVFTWGTSNPVGNAHTTGSVRVVSPAAFPDYSAPDGGISGGAAGGLSAGGADGGGGDDDKHAPEHPD
jgi:hypothetical protein